MGITFAAGAFISQPTSTLLEITQGAVGVWFRRSGRPAGTQQSIFSKHASSSAEGFLMYLENTVGGPFDTLHLGCANISGTNRVSLTATPQIVYDGNWHLASANLQIASGAANDLYLDGGNKVSVNASGAWDLGGSPQPIRFARDNDAFWGSFDGSMAHGFYYSETLTDAEHMALACGVSPLSIRPHALLFYLPMTSPNFVFNSIRNGLAEPTTSGTLSQAAYDAPLAPLTEGFLFDRDWYLTAIRAPKLHFTPIRSARRR